MVNVHLLTCHPVGLHMSAIRDQPQVVKFGESKLIELKCDPHEFKMQGLTSSDLDPIPSTSSGPEADLAQKVSNITIPLILCGFSPTDLRKLSHL